MTGNAEILTLQVRRTFEAPRARLYEAWTTASQLKQWFGRPEGYEIGAVEMDVRVGGAYRIEIGGTGGSAIVGTYHAVSPVDRLAFTFAWEPATWEVMQTGETLVTVDFREVNGATEIVITHECLQGTAVSGFHEFGWTNAFDRLELLLAAGEGT